jgi:uncharacterized membrane protein (UPF0136 family)
VREILESSSAMVLTDVFPAVTAAAEVQAVKVERNAERSRGSVPVPAPPSDYLFVSNIRYMAMVSIVWVHTVHAWGFAAPHSFAAYLQDFFYQLMKFGTIDFFLISGFLLGEGLTRGGRLKYFNRRVKVVFVPWLFWGVVWFVIALTHRLVKDGSTVTLGASLAVLIRDYFTFVFTQSIYWFVPNFFICLFLVLTFYKRVPDYVQGGVYLLFSLFYGLNTYLELIPPKHTSALLGFVFYLWLGSFAYDRRKVWIPWLDRTAWWRLIGYTAVAGLLSLVEIHLLRSRHSVDEFNTLRFANQAYSVLVALLVMKFQRALFPRYFAPRLETFGIFLIHPILVEIWEIVSQSISPGTMLRIEANGPLEISLGLASFVVIYMGAVLLTKQIRKVPLMRWMVGR